MRRLLQVCVAALMLAAVPMAASAQTAIADDDRSGLLGVGAMGGMVMDSPGNWLLFGADARWGLGSGIELQPRITYQPLDQAHVIQLDANVIADIALANPGKVRPFFGGGGALRMLSVDKGTGDTSVGLNVVTGIRFPLSSSAGYEPFVIGQYTIIHGQANVYSAVVGATFRIGH
jgi:hypothetical protein